MNGIAVAIDAYIELWFRGTPLRGYGKWSLLAEADGRKARPAKH